MKRGASGEIFLKTIAKARRIVPNLVLRTSFIVGFPGETALDFDELFDFVRAAEFDWMGVFAYSDEEGSPAFHLGKKVPAREIERRRRKLMQLQKQISRKRQRALVGREFDILLQGPSEETELLWEGRTMRHAPEIDGKVFVNDFGEQGADDTRMIGSLFYRNAFTLTDSIEKLFKGIAVSNTCVIGL